MNVLYALQENIVLAGKSNKIWDGYCEAGYWCIKGASEKASTDGDTGEKCSPR